MCFFGICMQSLRYILSWGSLLSAALVNHRRYKDAVAERVTRSKDRSAEVAFSCYSWRPETSPSQHWWGKLSPFYQVCLNVVIWQTLQNTLDTGSVKRLQLMVKIHVSRKQSTTSDFGKRRDSSSKKKQLQLICLSIWLCALVTSSAAASLCLTLELPRLSHRRMVLFKKISSINLSIEMTWTLRIASSTLPSFTAELSLYLEVYERVMEQIASTQQEDR